MAYVEQKECKVCQKITYHTNGKCNDCKHRGYLKKVHKWDAMSYDDRLTDLRKRMEELEAGPPRY